MNTTTTPVIAESVTVEPKIGLVARVRSSIMVKLAGIMALLGLGSLVTAGGASAADPGLLGGAETSFFDSITEFFTGSLLPLVFVLAAVVIGAGLLIRYGRKAVSS